MEAIRKICSTEQGKLTLQLPHSFWNCEVEVIVLPLHKKTEPLKTKKSLFGIFQQYAKPELIDQEKLAWQNAVENYDSC